MAERGPGLKLQETIVPTGIGKSEEMSMTLSRANNPIRPPRSDENLARTVVSVTKIEASRFEALING